MGIAKVPDPRLDTLTEMFEPQRVTPAEVQYVDISTYPEGKSKTRGIGGQMLNTLQQCDALLLVVRAFKSPSVPHPEGTVDPYRDLAINAVRAGLLRPGHSGAQTAAVAERDEGRLRPVIGTGSDEMMS